MCLCFSCFTKNDESWRNSRLRQLCMFWESNISKLPVKCMEQIFYCTDSSDAGKLKRTVYSINSVTQVSKILVWGIQDTIKVHYMEYNIQFHDFQMIFGTLDITLYTHNSLFCGTHLYGRFWGGFAVAWTELLLQQSSYTTLLCTKSQHFKGSHYSLSHCVTLYF